MNAYRFGFNGQEKSPEIGDNHYTAKFWEYDSRIGRRWNLDPVVVHWESPYATFRNSPIAYADPDGDIPLSKIVRKMKRFSSRFGSRTHPVTGEKGKPHTGIDVSASKGSCIFAAAHGTVTFAAWDDKYDGYKIVLKHGDKYTTSYSHIMKGGILVKVGDEVTNGQEIARVGSTGRSTGPHLHFQVNQNGTPINPEINGDDNPDYETYFFGAPKTLDKWETKRWDRLQNKIKNLQSRIQINESWGGLFKRNMSDNISALQSKITEAGSELTQLKKTANLRREYSVEVGEIKMNGGVQ